MEIDLEKYNHTCYIVGGGTSLKDFNWELLNDKFVIAINSAHIALPNCNIIYVTDPPYITANLATLKAHQAPVWQGAINCVLPKKLDVVDRQWHLTGPEGLETRANSLRHGSNSTLAATNMAAAHLGFKTIYLLGIDMQWGKKGDKSSSHWHSGTNPHKRIDPESVYQKMIQGWKSIKQPLQQLGVQVININTPEGTALKEFPIKSKEEVFDIT